MSAPALYTFPENATLQELERERSIAIDQQTIGSRLFPLAFEQTENVLWEIRDNVTGLMFHRGAEEPYPNRQDTGVKRYAIVPGRFGEIVNFTEQQIEKCRKVGTFGEAIDVSAEGSRMMEESAVREHALIETIRWTLAVSGVVNVANNAGVLTEIGRFNPQTYTPSVAWTTTATATPINDFRKIRDQFVGYGFDFGYGAEAYASSVTLNKLWQNTNPADLYGKRGITLSGINGLEAYNSAIVGAESIPRLVAVDDGYLDSSGVFQRYIPEGKVLIVGKHWARGLNCGEYVVTTNAALNGMAGFYAGMGIDTRPPHLPWVARGHNGGPRINYGRQFVVATMYTP